MKNEADFERTGFGKSVGTVAAYLEVTGVGGARPELFPVHDEVVIGREPQDSLAADKFLCIPEHTVSRRHARIRRRADGYFIEDLHSFNGTFVLDKRLTPGSWQPLRDGDEISVSSAVLVFHSMVPEPRENMPTIITRSVDATELTRLMEPSPNSSEADVNRTVQKLSAMAQVGIALGVVTDRETLIEKIMKFIFDLFPLAERAFIMLRKNEREAPSPVASRRRDGTVENPSEARMSRTIIEEVLNKKHSVLSVDTLSDRHFGTQESIVSQAIRSVMCVPLIIEDECLGLIQVDTSSDPYAFKEQDLEMLTGVCAETAVALKNFQLYSDIEQLLDGFVRASVQAIEERDPVTAGHSFRVANYSEHLAGAVDRAGGDLHGISFSRDQLREIRYAALLHDFGKVGVREHVLSKQKKLHPYEMRQLELRFKYAQACLERHAYRELADKHARHAMSIADFRDEKERIDEYLRKESVQLKAFLEAIHRANEPTVLNDTCATDLRAIAEYAFTEAAGERMPLLEAPEFSALSLSRGSLTPEERRQIEMHVVDSYSFLILIPWTRDLSAVPAIAHGHHEKLDGSGYPMGLRGPQISVQTRILTICDIFDALTAGDRPYKRAMPVESALDVMEKECRAGHLDPRLFNVFVDARVWSATSPAG